MPSLQGPDGFQFSNVGCNIFDVICFKTDINGTYTVSMVI